MKTIPLHPAPSLPKTAGLDISDTSITVVELDDHGNIERHHTIDCTPDAVEAWATTYTGKRVVFEACTHSPWLARRLQPFDLEVLVANPRKLRLISQNHSKSDAVDAELLARLARVDPKLLTPIQHRSQAMAYDLVVLRARAALVKARTQLVNTVRSLVKTTGHRLPKSTTATFHTLEADIPEPIQPLLASMMLTIECITYEIREYDKTIKKLAKDRYPAALHLQQVAGVGPVTALYYVLTIGDPNRFKDSRKVGAYLGLRPRRSQSGTTDPELPITKAGDSTLRKLLIQCAHYILGPFGPDCELKRWGLKLRARGGTRARMRAIVAVARKLSVLLHRLWVTGKDYDPFYAQQRAATQ